MKEPTYNWDSIHSSILANTLYKLEEAKIKYFILRNYEGLPENNNSKDVDIIIEPGKFKDVQELFIEVLRANNISNYYQMDFERAHCCFGIDVEKKFAIHLDFIEGYANKGYEFVSFEELYANTVMYKTFRVLNDSYDSCILLLYKLIGCKQLKDKYQEKIYRDFTAKGSNCSAVIKNIVGEKLGDEISSLIISNSFDKLLAMANDIDKVSKRRIFCRKPVATLIGMFKFYWEKFVNMVICPASKQHLIAVEAPDGTGKTTFIDALRIKISEYFVTDIEKTTVYHFRPTFLANLGAVGERAGVMKQDKDFTNPHRAKPANPISSLLRYIYYWMDYVIGVPIIVRKGAQFDHFPIFDRYIYDFIVDPARTRINLPRWVRVLFAHLVKQPRLIFVLSADVETIYERKQELSKEEIDRQLKEFRKLGNLGDHVHFIDAKKSPDEMTDEAIRIIVEKFTHKI